MASCSKAAPKGTKNATHTHAQTDRNRPTNSHAGTWTYEVHQGHARRECDGLTLERCKLTWRHEAATKVVRASEFASAQLGRCAVIFG